MSLVSIGRPKAAKRTPAAHCADGFFSLGMLAAAIGTTLGLVVWLVLSGKALPFGGVVALREIHAFVQLYILIGGFICGFLLQATPTFLGVDSAPYKTAAIAALVMMLASGISSLVGLWEVARIGIASTFLLILLAISPLMRLSNVDTKVRLCAPYAFGLLVLAVSATLFKATPVQGAFALWGGAAPIIFATAQRFISGSFDAPRIRLSILSILYSFHLASVIMLGTAAVVGANVPWGVLSVCCVLVLIGYLLAAGVPTRALQVARSRNPMALGILLGFAWAITGAVVAANPDRLDVTVHAWGAGWAFTLIMAVSSRVVQQVTLHTTLKPAVLVSVLLSWQLVVLARAFHGARILPEPIYWVCTLVGCLAVLVWLGGLTRAIVGVIASKGKAQHVAAH